MAGIEFIQHQGRRVLLLDLSEVGEPTRALDLIAKSRATVAAQPKRKDLLVVLDVNRMFTNDQVLKAFRELAQHNAPWVLASAVCNPSKLGRVITRAHGLITNRTFALFDSRAEALDWVVAEGARALGQVKES